MKRGMRSQAERGSWQYGHAPDGYAVVDGKLVVPEETRATFEVMKRIIWEYAGGYDGGLRIAEGPARREEPGVDEIDAEAFRAAVLEAWSDQPSAERRSALAQLLRRVTLTPGGVTSTFGDCQDGPAGPPKASSARDRVRVEAPVNRPRVRRVSATAVPRD